MSDSEIGVNSSNEILKELLVVAKNIQGLLSQKTDQEIRAAQEINETTNESKGSPQVTVTAQDPPNDETAIVEVHDHNGWPSVQKIAEYRIRCEKHKSECKKMQVELGCFIAHLGVVGGDEEEIGNAESLRKGLLNPVQSLEKAFDATHTGRPTAMEEVRKSFDRLDDFVRDFSWSPHQKDAIYPDKVEQWRSITLDGYRKIRDLVLGGKFVDCLEFIHDVFFSELEMAMGGAVEALTTFEEKSAMEGLTKQKIKDYGSWCAEYIKIVFPSWNGIGEQGGWPESHEYEHFGQRLAQHRRLCEDMRVELDHLASHYIIIGGDKEVIKASNILKEELLSHAQYLEDVVKHRPYDFQTKMRDVITKLLFAVIRFQSSLYHQKHAFYFRNVKQWVTCTWIGAHRILSLLQHGEEFQCMSYVHNTFLIDFDRAMIGMTLNKLVKSEEKAFSAVPEELKTFGKESLPKFLVDQMERDTTRYINLTTIATFFSSVTATTLQFTYAPTDAEPSNSLRGVVNLFWFLSLVFSVSSGVSSLLGLTWRKSSIYDSCVPPKLIRMWFDKAPMLFLIIAAFAFVIGLNMFAYLSLQTRYVCLSTTILTGIHGACLLTVTAWFIYQLKHESVWAGWVRTVMKPITTIIGWISTGMKWIWKTVKRPYQKYKQNLHLQRNIYWAFGIDNRVARLNYDIDWIPDWPEPYLLSKLIRLIAYPMKRCWQVTKNALSQLWHWVRNHICVSSYIVNVEGDTESGARSRRDTAAVIEEDPSQGPAEKAKNEFRRSLQKVFSSDDRVEKIMDIIEITNDEIADNHPNARPFFRTKLWGYPDLITKLFEEVQPALVEEREKGRGNEVEAQPETMVQHVDNVPEVTDETEGKTALAPSKSFTPVSFDDGPRPVLMVQTNAQPDSGTRPIDRPPASDECHLSTVIIESTEVLEPTSGSPVPLDMEEAPASPSEIEEVPGPFTLDPNNEGLCVAQSKEESGK